MKFATFRVLIQTQIDETIPYMYFDFLELRTHERNHPDTLKHPSTQANTHINKGIRSYTQNSKTRTHTNAHLHIHVHKETHTEIHKRQTHTSKQALTHTPTQKKNLQKIHAAHKHRQT